VRLIEALVALAEARIVRSAHDISDGGLATALAECCFASNGLSVEASVEGASPAEPVIFGESGARAVVSMQESSLAELRGIAAKWDVAAKIIGRVSRGLFQLTYNRDVVIRESPATLRSIWAGALQRQLFGDRLQEPA
jgi:phosphoribosylformylglycinamidine synthase